VRLRTKAYLVAMGLTLSGMLVLGSLMYWVLRDTYLDETGRRARAFLEVLAVECTPHLASNRIDGLDKIVSSLIERNLEQEEIRFVAILDVNRRVLAHTSQSHFGWVMDDPFTRDASASRHALVREEREEGGRILKVSMPLASAIPREAGLRWGTLVAGLGLARAEKALGSLVFQVAMLTLLVALVTMLVLTLLLDRGMVRPIRRLTDVAHAFASGDLSARAATDGSKGDVPMLAATFNDMAERIEQHTRELEEEIQARTQELRTANERLQELATTDGLTSLFNFRQFSQALSSEVQRCTRLRVPLSLLMMDVDHFKCYNDTHGHPAGDEVLRTVARLLRQRVRSTDLPCRYGGEEFAVLLLDADKTSAAQVAEQIRDTIEQTRFAGEETQPGGSLTVSIGVASVPEDAKDGDELVKAADRALYRAKNDGRNRVSVSGTGAIPWTRDESE
jgi:diguanylate cyclase (GGDEF)-like protein